MYNNDKAWKQLRTSHSKWRQEAFHEEAFHEEAFHEEAFHEEAFHEEAFHEVSQDEPQEVNVYTLSIWYAT